MRVSAFGMAAASLLLSEQIARSQQRVLVVDGEPDATERAKQREAEYEARRANGAEQYAAIKAEAQRRREAARAAQLERDRPVIDANAAKQARKAAKRLRDARKSSRFERKD